jgi:hypothetical protein
MLSKFAVKEDRDRDRLTTTADHGVVCFDLKYVIIQLSMPLYVAFSSEK